MISQSQNDQLTRVGPGTLMGNLLRQYWLPLGLSSELPHPDCDPVRMRLLGENLIGFRMTSGEVGLIAEKCPHRGASLFLGRNEEGGIRCIYHGWKFDGKGTCLDMPSEPANSPMKKRLKARTYPCIERGGLIWTYMGPSETPPPLPHFEGNIAGQKVTANAQNANWLQVLDNNFDIAHGSFLHLGALTEESEWQPWMEQVFRTREKLNNIVRYRWMETFARANDTGASSAVRRPALDQEDTAFSYSIANFLFPFYEQTSTSDFDAPAKVVAVVPVDDAYTISYFISDQIPDFPHLPNTTGWHGRFAPRPTQENDFLINRDVQRHEDSTLRAYTGIDDIHEQDIAAIDSQGAIQDRTQEHLATTDRMIAMVRRRLLEAAIALRDHGTIPPGVETPENYAQRSGTVVLDKETDVWEATRPQREWFRQSPTGDFTTAM